MAHLRLHVTEAAACLPRVCMRCGEDASTYQLKWLTWYPWWAAIFIVLDYCFFSSSRNPFARQARIEAPFCAKHRGHWSHRTNLTWLSFLSIYPAVVATFFVSEYLPWDFTCFNTVLLGFVLLGIWFVIACVCRFTSIQATNITDDDITLWGVCDEFVNAVEDAREARQARERELEECRDTAYSTQKQDAIQDERRRRHDESYTDDARPRSAPPPNAIEE